MTLIEAVKSAYANYVNFSGRAQRSAYWWWALFQFVVGAIIALAEGGGSMTSGDGAVGVAVVGGLFTMLWTLINLLPGLSLLVRRLHDTDRSGWWALILFVPLIGVIVLLVWLCSKGTSGVNRFGRDPMAGDLSSTFN